MYENSGVHTEQVVTGDTVMGVYSWVMLLVIFAYCAFMQYKIAHKTGQSDTAWWAFIPIANIFFFFKLWIDTARNCGQSGVWGFLVMVPAINLLALLVLAMSTRPYEYPEDTFPPETDRPKKPQQVG